MPSSSSYGRNTAIDSNGGRSFMAASTLETGLSGVGVIRACLYLVGSLEDKLRLLLGPWLDSSKPLLGISLPSSCLSGEAHGWRHSARHIVHNIRSWGCLRHRLALAVAVVLHTHKHTTGMPLPRLGSSSLPRHPLQPPPHTVSREQLKFKLKELVQLYLVIIPMGYH